MNSPEQKKLDMKWNLLLSAWIIALCASLGALFIGEVMGQAPCVLCWYQRIAMFPLALILGIACLSNDLSVWRYALPLSLAGFAIALWHSLLYAGIVAEAIVPCSESGPSCTSSDMLLLSVLPLPYLSLVCFGSLTALLTVTSIGQKS